MWYSSACVSYLCGEVYSIQHYVIKFVSDLWQVGDFPPESPVFSTNKTDRQDIIIWLNDVVNVLDVKSAHTLVTLATWTYNVYVKFRIDNTRQTRDQVSIMFKYNWQDE
jgi:hypothetical protein